MLLKIEPHYQSLPVFYKNVEGGNHDVLGVEVTYSKLAGKSISKAFKKEANVPLPINSYALRRTCIQRF